MPYPIFPVHTISKATEKTLLSSLPPLSLYLHFPWCVEKCPYCDFNSHKAPQSLPEAAYLNAILRDVEASLPLIWGRNIVSIFMGGGTPSLFSPQSIDTLLSALHARLTILPGAEISMEANPGTVDFQKFADFKQAGINRLSLGIQSFSAPLLKKIGRIHNAQEALKAAEAATRIFENVNLDLMYGLPDQTMADFQHDLATACSFSPTHLSCYQLTLEPHTAFFQNPPALPDEDLCADMQVFLEETLAAYGFIHYETSAFAKPHRFCQHNFNYWQFGDYLGLGAGAHSKLSFHNKIERQVRVASPKDYLKGAPFMREAFNISPKDLVPEFMMNALRLINGFSASLLKERTGTAFSELQQAFACAEKDGLITWQDGNIRPSLKGQRFLNRLIGCFLAE